MEMVDYLHSHSICNEFSSTFEGDEPYVTNKLIATSSMPFGPYSCHLFISCCSSFPLLLCCGVFWLVLMFFNFLNHNIFFAIQFWQIYAWIGCNSAKFGHLYAAAPTRPVSYTCTYFLPRWYLSWMYLSQLRERDSVLEEKSYDALKPCTC